MNKREVVWLIVRLIGVYFAYLALLTFFTVAGSVSTLYSLGTDPYMGNETENARAVPGMPLPRPENDPRQTAKVDPAMDKQKNEAFRTVLKNIFITALYGGLAFYLIAKGGILFRLLSSETSTMRRQDETVTTLKL